MIGDESEDGDCDEVSVRIDLKELGGKLPKCFCPGIKI